MLIQPLLQSNGPLAAHRFLQSEQLVGELQVTLTSARIDIVEQGRLTEAEALHREALEGARRKLPDGHWHTGSYLGSYGKTLVQLERYVDAEAALLEAHRILETARGAKHERTMKVVKSFTDLYDAWHAAEPGKGYGAKAAEWRAKLPEPRD